MEELSLRERKKHATRVLLMETALSLFEEKGFDNVSVAEIAEAAEVSKATVFNYFPTKVDLVLAGGKAHISEPANVVRSRPVGQTPHSALRAYFLRMLKHHEPMAGLSLHPLVLRVQRIVRQTPGLALKAMDHRRQASELLAQALIEEGSSELTARLVATQLMHTQHILAQTNLQRIHAGETPEEIYPDAVATAEHAFRLLEHGIGDFMRREAEPSDAPDTAFHDTGSRAEADCRVAYAPGEDDTRRAVEQVLRDAEDEIFEELADPDRL
ncbi:TetR/AcrR family transcriptional regulator [Glycomyces tenuis]|uniref:TetR/AcrR family transcriptional regulator n=1 Tax=Glycomyces tenuis TaxID=58116 RepID=UPI0004127F98|nr:TetR/AcrR family transcriptional regulator [Glycomyces tenuis]